MTELLYIIEKAKYIYVLDIIPGRYRLIDVQKLTAFATPSSLYAWKVMPYGLRNSAATFQRIVNELFANHCPYTCAYIDDAGVSSETWPIIFITCTVMQAIQSLGHTINPAKRNFVQQLVKYLGYEVGSGIHTPDSDRV